MTTILLAQRMPRRHVFYILGVPGTYVYTVLRHRIQTPHTFPKFSCWKCCRFLPQLLIQKAITLSMRNIGLRRSMYDTIEEIRFDFWFVSISLHFKTCVRVEAFCDGRLTILYNSARGERKTLLESGFNIIPASSIAHSSPQGPLLGGPFSWPTCTRPSRRYTWLPTRNATIIALVDLACSRSNSRRSKSPLDNSRPPRQSKGSSWRRRTLTDRMRRRIESSESTEKWSKHEPWWPSYRRQREVWHTYCQPLTTSRRGVAGHDETHNAIFCQQAKNTRTNSTYLDDTMIPITSTQ